MMDSYWQNKLLNLYTVDLYVFYSNKQQEL